MNSLNLFRGFAKRTPSGSSPEEFARIAGLDWTVSSRKLAYVGARQFVTIPKMQAIVRDDTGETVGVASDDFKLHQNNEIVRELQSLAVAGDIQLTHGGYFAKSSTVFAVGGVDMKEEIGNAKKKGDIVSLQFLVTGGHKPGTPRKVTAFALRLVCLNGACVSERRATLTVSHRSNLADDKHGVKEFIESQVTEFKAYINKMRAIQATQASPAVQTAYLMALEAPELLSRVLEMPVGRTEREKAGISGADILNKLIEQDERSSMSNWLLFDALHYSKNVSKDERIPTPRIVSDITASIDRQPGAEYSVGTLAHPYHAYTHHLDHVTGRGDGEAAVTSALDGRGAARKQNALDLAVEWSEILRAR